tara:strand:+ start:3820 stop:4377 length:558 start_codon:yes stop_codon:yes gene_type:complete
LNFSLPESYLIGLTTLLFVIAILVGRQLLRTRADEMRLLELEQGGIEKSKDAGELYELGSVQLRKRLYPQATATLKKALKELKEEPNEAKALIENALGFSLAAQNDFKSAIIHYKLAIKIKEDYPVALNNLAFAKRKVLDTDEAFNIYQKVLEIDPNNKTALREFKRLSKTKSTKIEPSMNSKGF